MVLKGEAKVDYQREYMRKRRKQEYLTRDGVRPGVENPSVVPVMTVTERKERLSEIARQGNVRLTNPVEAIKELNKLEGSYPPVQHLVASKVQVEVIFVDRKHTPTDVIDVTPIELLSPGEDNATKQS